MKSDSLKDIQVSEFLSPVQSLSPTDSISKVIGHMQDKRSYEVFVEDGGRTAIVSIRDVLNVRNIVTTKISTLMRYFPRLGPSNTIGDAAGMMFNQRVRALPIYDNSDLIGQVTAQSIVKKLMETDQRVKLSNIMTPNPISVAADDEVGKARRIMLRKRIDQLPIMKDDKLHKVITSSSIAFNLLPSADRTVAGDWREKRFDVSVEDFAQPEVVSNEITDSLSDVFRNMWGYNTNYSMILNLDEIQGIMTYRDFMRLLYKERKIDSIPMYIVGLPENPFEAEATREKFRRIVTLMQRAFSVVEARAVIKTGKKKAVRTRYEVQVFVDTRNKRYSYRTFGFELPEVFDDVTDWSKKLVARTEKSERRARPDPELMT